MKRLLGILLSLSLVALGGCSAPEVQPQQVPAPAAPAAVEPREETSPQPQVSHPQPEPPSQPQVVEEAPVPPASIPAGVWLAKNDAGYTRYYEFHPDSLTGTYHSLEYDLEISFAYDGSGSALTFHPDGEEPVRSATLELVGPRDMTLHWDHTLAEELTLVEAESLKEFPFYTNAQLQDLAVDHYALNSGLPQEELPQLAASITNEDNSVTVQLYDNLGDHNSTAAWYLLDRFTARGTEMISGEEIDLSAEPESHAVPSTEGEQEPSLTEDLSPEQPPVDPTPGEEAVLPTEEALA